MDGLIFQLNRSDGGVPKLAVREALLTPAGLEGDRQRDLRFHGGLDWRGLEPGARLALGDEALVEVTRYTSPCKNIAESFADRDFKRISQKVHPGDSRVYARVIRPGRLAVGQSVRLI